MTALTDEIRAAIKAQLTARPQAPANAEARTYRFRSYWSDALGTTPGQVAETKSALRAKGIAAEFDDQGRCRIDSSKMFRDIATARGLRDGRDGFFPLNDEGHAIYSGREGVRRRNEFREQLRKMCR